MPATPITVCSPLILDMDDRIPWPSRRAQWSAFFATVLILLNISTVESPVSLAARFATVFLIFYFPVAWLYNYDFSLRSGDAAD
jgi:hypothetical protein